MNRSELLQLLYTELQVEEKSYIDLVQFSEAEGVLPQVYFLLRYSEKWAALPAYIKIDFENRVKKHIFLLKWLSLESQKIMKELSDQAIKIIPLKGGTFARQYFGDVCARSTSDLDILIHQHDFIRAEQYLISVGFVRTDEEIEGHFHTAFYRSIPGSEIPFSVEVHWGMMREDTANIDIQDFWDHAEREDVPCLYRLSDEDAFYFMCLHGWRHNMDSVKYYLDLIQILAASPHSIQLERLLERARNDQTYKRIKFVLNRLSQAAPFILNENKLKQFKIHQKLPPEGSYRAFFNYQFFSYDRPLHSLYEIKRWLFPSKSDLNTELKYKAVSYFKGIRALYYKRLTGAFK
ncbi:nucleotidyltransferase family protein [Jeotgalibacillus aurantiacus]|uniref:nucleotidyltransferase family protein n=1 Tax=Jeotgalibacillus aurantiacus TaxID=2763266 RepID=UPI001D09ADD1|nr:nucleotidyltransferase family protein [Jeotgalibacillus aurantiacus]